MIVDSLVNADIYAPINKKIEYALNYLSNTDLSIVDEGKYDLENGCFVIVQEYVTQPEETKRFEAHKKYIDIQYIVSGTERIGYTEVSNLNVIEAYNEDKDIIWLKGEGDFITLTEGCFMVLFPQDAHMPGVINNEQEKVRKAVVKIPV